MLQTFLIGFLLMLSCLTSQAQTAPNIDKADVMKNPVVWAKLKTDYHNDNLWAQYFGTDVFNLTKEQNQYIERWKSILQNQEILDAEEAQLKRQQLRHGSQTNTATSASERHYQSLLNNIAQNFVMIEDYFTEEFAKYGSVYHTYQEKYPTGNYDKFRWIQEQEKKLKELKAKH